MVGQYRNLKNNGVQWQIPAITKQLYWMRQNLEHGWPTLSATGPDLRNEFYKRAIQKYFIIQSE